MYFVLACTSRSNNTELTGRERVLRISHFYYSSAHFVFLASFPRRERAAETHVHHMQQEMFLLAEPAGAPQGEPRVDAAARRQLLQCILGAFTSSHEVRANSRAR